MTCHIIIILLALSVSVNCDDDEDGRYIDLLPEEEKREFIENVARRILEEVETKELAKKLKVTLTEAQMNKSDSYVAKIMHEATEEMRKRNNATKNNTVQNKGTEKTSTNDTSTNGTLRERSEKPGQYADLTLRSSDAAKDKRKEIDLSIEITKFRRNSGNNDSETTIAKKKKAAKEFVKLKKKTTTTKPEVKTKTVDPKINNTDVIIDNSLSHITESTTVENMITSSVTEVSFRANTTTINDLNVTTTSQPINDIMSIDGKDNIATNKTVSDIENVIVNENESKLNINHIAIAPEKNRRTDKDIRDLNEDDFLLYARRKAVNVIPEENSNEKLVNILKEDDDIVTIGALNSTLTTELPKTNTYTVSSTTVTEATKVDEKSTEPPSKDENVRNKSAELTSVTSFEEPTKSNLTEPKKSKTNTTDNTHIKVSHIVWPADIYENETIDLNTTEVVKLVSENELTTTEAEPTTEAVKLIWIRTITPTTVDTSNTTKADKVEITAKDENIETSNVSTTTASSGDATTMSEVVSTTISDVPTRTSTVKQGLLTTNSRRFLVDMESTKFSENSETKTETIVADRNTVENTAGTEISAAQSEKSLLESKNPEQKTSAPETSAPETLAPETSPPEATVSPENVTEITTTYSDYSDESSIENTWLWKRTHGLNATKKDATDLTVIPIETGPTTTEKSILHQLLSDDAFKDVPTEVLETTTEVRLISAMSTRAKLISHMTPKSVRSPNSPEVLNRRADIGVAQIKNEATVTNPGVANDNSASLTETNSTKGILSTTSPSEITTSTSVIESSPRNSPATDDSTNKPVETTEIKITEKVTEVTTKKETETTTGLASKVTTEVVTKVATQGATDVATHAPAELATEKATEIKTKIESKAAAEIMTDKATTIATKAEAKAETKVATERVTVVVTPASVEIATESTTEVATEKATEKATESATLIVTEKTTQIPTERATETATAVVTVIATEKTTEGVTERSTDTTTAKFTEAVTEVTTDKVTEIATDKVTEIEKVTEVATDNVTEVATDKVTEVATDKVTEIATQASINKVTETATEKVTEKATEIVVDRVTETAAATVTKKATQGATKRTLRTTQKSDHVVPVANKSTISEYYDKKTETTVTTDKSTDNEETTAKREEETLTTEGTIPSQLTPTAYDNLEVKNLTKNPEPVKLKYTDLVSKTPPSLEVHNYSVVPIKTQGDKPPTQAEKPETQDGKPPRVKLYRPSSSKGASAPSLSNALQLDLIQQIPTERGLEPVMKFKFKQEYNVYEVPAGKPSFKPIKTTKIKPPKQKKKKPKHKKPKLPKYNNEEEASYIPIYNYAVETLSFNPKTRVNPHPEDQQLNLERNQHNEGNIERVPVYDYSAQNAYFNPANRQHPNPDDKSISIARTNDGKNELDAISQAELERILKADDDNDDKVRRERVDQKEDEPDAISQAELERILREDDDDDMVARGRVINQKANEPEVISQAELERILQEDDKGIVGRAGEMDEMENEPEEIISQVELARILRARYDENMMRSTEGEDDNQNDYNPNTITKDTLLRILAENALNKPVLRSPLFAYPPNKNSQRLSITNRDVEEILKEQNENFTKKDLLNTPLFAYPPNKFTHQLRITPKDVEDILNDQKTDIFVKNALDSARYVYNAPKTPTLVKTVKSPPAHKTPIIVIPAKSSSDPNTPLITIPAENPPLVLSNPANKKSGPLRMPREDFEEILQDEDQDEEKSIYVNDFLAVPNTPLIAFPPHKNTQPLRIIPKDVEDILNGQNQEIVVDFDSETIQPNNDFYGTQYLPKKANYDVQLAVENLNDKEVNSNEFVSFEVQSFRKSGNPSLNAELYNLQFINNLMKTDKPIKSSSSLLQGLLIPKNLVRNLKSDKKATKVLLNNQLIELDDLIEGKKSFKSNTDLLKRFLLTKDLMDDLRSDKRDTLDAMEKGLADLEYFDLDYYYGQNEGNFRSKKKGHKKSKRHKIGRGRHYKSYFPDSNEASHPYHALKKKRFKSTQNLVQGYFASDNHVKTLDDFREKPSTTEPPTTTTKPKTTTTKKPTPPPTPPPTKPTTKATVKPTGTTVEPKSTTKPLVTTTKKKGRIGRTHQEELDLIKYIVALPHNADNQVRFRNKEAELNAEKSEEETNEINTLYNTIVNILNQNQIIKPKGKNVVQDLDPQSTNVQKLDPQIAKEEEQEDSLEPFVTEMGHMIKTDNKALVQYNWLKTAVDVQSALRKMIAVTENYLQGKKIHPYDVQLIKFTFHLYEESVRLFPEARRSDTRSYLPKTNQQKYGLKIKMKKLGEQTRNDDEETSDDDRIKDEAEKREMYDFLGFLVILDQSLNQLHEALKQIATISQYKSQRWFKNLKELYLTKSSRKKLLEVNLHLFTAKLVNLIDTSSNNGADKDYVAYLRRNRVEIDEIVKQFTFVLRFLYLWRKE